MESSPSVLIVRLDAIGDALALVPLLAALRERAARIDIVLTPRNAQVFSKNAVDRVYIGEQPTGQYDYALIATEDPAGYRVARAATARHRIGFENGWGKPVKTLWTRMLCTRTVHRTAGLDPRAPHECEVLFALGSDIVGTDKPPRDPAVLRRFVVDADEAPDPRVVMQVTSKWERLGASSEEVAQLARELQAQHTIRFLSAENERGFAQRLAANANVEVEYFRDLPPWKDAIASARALIAPDSGAVHVAGMTGTPAVAVFAPQHFRIQTARWSPWAAPNRLIGLEGAWPAAASSALSELLNGTPGNGTA